MSRNLYRRGIGSITSGRENGGHRSERLLRRGIDIGWVGIVYFDEICTKEESSVLRDGVDVYRIFMDESVKHSFVTVFHLKGWLLNYGSLSRNLSFKTFLKDSFFDGV